MDPSERQKQALDKKVESTSKPPSQEKAEASQLGKQSNPSEVAKETALTDKTATSAELSPYDAVPATNEMGNDEVATSSDQQVPINTVATDESPKGNSENAKPSDIKPAAKKLPQYGGTNVSPYKYILGKPYHPSKHFADLRGLSNDKSGGTDLIQVCL
jgi:hypothetical protein